MIMRKMLLLLLLLVFGSNVYATKVGQSITPQNASQYGFDITINNKDWAYEVTIKFPKKNDQHSGIGDARLQRYNADDKQNNLDIPLELYSGPDIKTFKLYFHAGTKVIEQSSIRLSGATENATIIYFIKLKEFMKN